MYFCIVIWLIEPLVLLFCSLNGDSAAFWITTADKESAYNPRYFSWASPPVPS